MARIVFDDVWKSYGDAIVLERINFTLDDNEFLMIVGPSGAGKSTLLRMLISQEVHSRGKILIDDQPIAAEPTLERGVVFQRYSVFPHLRMLENVLAGPQWARGLAFGMSRAERRELKEHA